MSQCEQYICDPSAYWTRGERRSIRCSGTAVAVVKVNPPTKNNSGLVRLCDFCNRWDYQGFPRLVGVSETGEVP